MQTHNSSLANLCRGVGERVLYVNSKLDRPIQPLDGIFEKRLSHYRDRLALEVGWQSPVTRQEFVGFYKGPRQRLYQNAVDGLEILPHRPRDATLKTFVKAEKNDLSIKPDPVPRVIQPRDPRYNVEIGRYLRPIEKKVYAAINELFGSPTIMSEFNCFRSAEVIFEKWSSFSDPVCIGLDASRFDQHVSVQALKFEHKFYDMLFHSAELRGLLGLQINNRGIAVANDGYFKYNKRGCRMSGDMNTSLGNKIIMCLMGLSYIDSKNFRIEFVNNGDDCLLITNRKNLSKLEDLSAFFVNYGFNIVREDPVFEFEHIEFCQTKPVHCNGVWRMVRKTSACLTKDVTCVSLGHDVLQYRSWLRDVGRCGLSMARDIPVLGAFYEMLVRIGADGNYSSHGHKEYNWYYRASLNAKCHSKTPDDQGRYSYWLSSGISPDQQLQIEAHLNSMVWGDNERQFIDDLNTLING